MKGGGGGGRGIFLGGRKVTTAMKMISKEAPRPPPWRKKCFIIFAVKYIRGNSIVSAQFSLFYD